MPGPVRIVRPRVAVRETCTDFERRICAATPDGDLTETWQLDAGTQSWHPVEFPVKTREDALRRRWLYREVKVSVDKQGKRGRVWTGAPTSPTSMQ